MVRAGRHSGVIREHLQARPRRDRRCVAALLGKPDAAMARLREALEEGAWPRWLHQEPALDILRGRPDFIALTAPKG